MPTFTRILLDINALEGAHPAFARALDLAGRCGARLKIVDVVPALPQVAQRHLPPRLESDLVGNRRQRLEQLAQDARAAGTTVATDVLRGQPAVAVIREVLQSGHDLVMRAHGRGEGPQAAFGPIDQQLLRKCPVPVWLIGPAAERPRHVVAAVDATADDPVEQQLNRRLIDLACAVGKLHDSEVTLLHAWSVFGEELLRSHMSESELSECVEVTRREAADSLQGLRDATSEPVDQSTLKLDLVKGRPDEAIRQYVETHEVDLVVMGTVARTGLAGILMGNTAERILHRLRTSVLALKPEEFVCPVRLDADH
ncbi:MAG: hypothetical protein GEV06_20190 [Luteitalea sp.]|nr:hypothetical protein [Luteitalea sp.]